MGAGYEIARGLRLLIKDGHPPASAWRYTPREIAGWAQLASRDRAATMAETIIALRLSKLPHQKAAKVVKDLYKEAE